MQLNKKERRSWLTYIARLKAKLPTSKPVMVRSRRTRQRNDEEWYLYDDQWYIVIGSHLNYYQRIDALEHAYAHVLDELDEHAREEHRDSWGKWYSRVHRARLEIDDEIRQENDDG